MSNDAIVLLREDHKEVRRVFKEFQKAEVMVAPALQTEGKSLQRAQGIGMGH